MFPPFNPVHCPDLIAGLQRRVRDGQDEMQLMSYNNGLISAHTAREFEAAVRRGITNANGSGLRDLFGKHVVRMVRPQQMLYTPIHLKLYKACGIDSIGQICAPEPPLHLVDHLAPGRAGGNQQHRRFPAVFPAGKVQHASW